jgi:hypothetical protein
LEEGADLAGVYQRFYAIRAVIFVLFSFFLSLALWYGVIYIAQRSNSVIIRAYLDHLAQEVFLISLPGYILLSWALFNNVFLFALSRPEHVIYNLVISLAVNVVVGFLLTRLFGHPFAAVGFTIGSFVLAVLSTITTINVIKDMDYYYYSAYL